MKFYITANWLVNGILEIEAETFKDALNKAKDMSYEDMTDFMSENNIDFVEGSIEIVVDTMAETATENAIDKILTILNENPESKDIIMAEVGKYAELNKIPFQKALRIVFGEISNYPDAYECDPKNKDH